MTDTIIALLAFPVPLFAPMLAYDHWGKIRHLWKRGFLGKLVVLPVRKIESMWSSMHAFLRNLIIVASIIILSFFISFIVPEYLSDFIPAGDDGNVIINIFSSVMSLLKEIIGGVNDKFTLFIVSFIIQVTIWARVTSNIQASHAAKQIELTRLSNSNEVFLEATRMLSSGGKNIITSVSGLQLIIKLAKDDPENEYIRCTEFLCSWLRKNYPAAKKQQRVMPWEVRSLVSAFLGQEFSEVRGQLEEYMKKYNFTTWPVMSQINLQKMLFEKADLPYALFEDANLKGANFQNANLEGANFRNANLQRAKLKNANFKDANISNAKFYWAQHLTEEQVLSAKWYEYYGKKEPPQLTKKIGSNRAIRMWLKTAGTNKEQTHWDES